MASTQRYVGMKTPFGVIVEVEACVYDPLCVVKAKDGSTELSPACWRELTLGKKPLACASSRVLRRF